MKLFQAVRRYKKWIVRVPLWDARECPDCSGLVIGDKGQDAHRAYHEAIWQFQEETIEAIRQTAAGAGLTTGYDEIAGGEADGLELRDDELHDAKRRRVPWRIAMMTDSENEEPLTRRVLASAGGDDDDYAGD